MSETCNKGLDIGFWDCYSQSRASRFSGNSLSSTLEYELSFYLKCLPLCLESWGFGCLPNIHFLFFLTNKTLILFGATEWLARLSHGQGNPELFSQPTLWPRETTRPVLANETQVKGALLGRLSSLSSSFENVPDIWNRSNHISIKKAKRTSETPALTPLNTSPTSHFQIFYSVGQRNHYLFRVSVACTHIEAWLTSDTFFYFHSGVLSPGRRDALRLLRDSWCLQGFSRPLIQTCQNFLNLDPHLSLTTHSFPHFSIPFSILTSTSHFL